jgi:hypothetical protein
VVDKRFSKFSGPLEDPEDSGFLFLLLNVMHTFYFKRSFDRSSFHFSRQGDGIVMSIC